MINQKIILCFIPGLLGFHGILHTQSSSWRSKATVDQDRSNGHQHRHGHRYRALPPGQLSLHHRPHAHGDRGIQCRGGHLRRQDYFRTILPDAGLRDDVLLRDRQLQHHVLVEASSRGCSSKSPAKDVLLDRTTKYQSNSSFAFQVSITFPF